jgi:cbb3-type cytochrome oxidase maturation protein
MSALYLLIPVSVLLAAVFVALCLAAIRRGQFDDMESPKWRILFDDPGLPAPPERKAK